MRTRKGCGPLCLSRNGAMQITLEDTGEKGIGRCIWDPQLGYFIYAEAQFINFWFRNKLPSEMWWHTK